MGTLKHVQPGQPIGRPSAAVHNAMVDAALDFQQRRASQTGRPQIGGGDYGVVLVRNDSGYTCDRYFVLGVDDPIILPTDNLDEFHARVAFSCSLPNIEVHFGKFVVLLEPLADGAMGRGLMSGVCPVVVVSADPDAKWADVTDSSVQGLTAAETGFAKILWMGNPNNQAYQAYVQLGVRGPTSLWATLGEALAEGGDAFAWVLEGYPLTQTNRQVVVYDALLSDGDSLGSGERVKLDWIGNRWWVTGARC